MSDQGNQVFSGRYELVRHLARGGMAEVYLAHDLMLDRNVALKVLFPELSTDRSFVERFRREAQAAANLSHPNIVSIYDWGEEEGTYFIVMEYIEGRTLGQTIRGEGPLLADRAADIAADTAAALAFAHRSGVVHRDVKPGNVLMSTTGEVKVTDFGIARAANSDQDLTQTGAVMGTATYFSPEQAQGEQVDARSDVYSLGVVLYEMVTGKPPFAGDNPMSVAYKHVREEPVPPRQVNADVPIALEGIVLQAMAKNAADRYASADEMRQDLLRFRQGRPVLADPTVAVPVLVDQSATRAVPAYDSTQMVEQTAGRPVPPPEKNSTGAFVLILLVMLLLLGGLLYLFAREAGIIGDGAPARVEVPQVVGDPVEEAVSKLEDAGLTVEQVNEPNDAEPGIVFDQNPKAGATADRNSSVTIKVSGGVEKVRLPNVVGQDVTRATDTLEQLGVQPRIKDVADARAPKNEVLGMNPGAGQEVDKGSVVELTVSQGKPEKQVPNVQGQEATDAAAELGGQGFKVVTRREPSATVKEGTVIRTDPPAGTRLEEGATVTMFVSTGPPEEETTTTTARPTTTTTLPATTTTRPGGGTTTTTTAAGA